MSFTNYVKYVDDFSALFFSPLFSPRPTGKIIAPKKQSQEMDQNFVTIQTFWVPIFVWAGEALLYFPIPYPDNQLEDFIPFPYKGVSQIVGSFVEKI